MRFLLTRPSHDSELLAKMLGDLGHDTNLEPVINIKRLPLPDLIITDYQGLIFTSTNGVLAFIEQAPPTDSPLFTVGDKTAEMAQKSGFTNIINAGGDVKKLSRTIINNADPTNGPLLYLRGAHIAADLNQRLEDADFTVKSSIIYEAVPSDTLQSQTINYLKKGTIDYIPFYSRRSALIFIELIKKAGLESCLSNVSALCLSQAIEKQIMHMPWKEILTTKKPTQKDLFEMINVELKG